MAEESSPRRLADFEKDIAKLEKMFTNVIPETLRKKPEHSFLIYQAEWHIRGMLYHNQRVFSHYSDFVREVSERAGTGANIIILYAPMFQQMLFELYALVNLCRIALDNLRLYLAPVFKTPRNQLPKSVRNFIKGAGDCSVLNLLCQQELFEYLVDLRNCLVHYRSFAIRDNAIVIEEGAEARDILEDNNPFFASMARAEFHRVGEMGIAINVYLPDRIFETDANGNKSLAKFTYDQKWNLLSMARSFTELGVVILTEAMRLLADTKEPLYTYSKGK